MSNQDYKTMVNAEPWPYNLILDVKTCCGIYLTDNNNEPQMIIPDELPSDIEGTIHYLLCRCTDRDRDIIVSHYKEHQTLEAIGRRYHVTRERIRQCLNLAVCKMSHGEGSKMIELGIKAYFNQLMELKMNGIIEQAKKDAYRKGWSDAIAKLDGQNVEPLESSKQQDDIKVTDLDFSVRTYNCLRVKGIKTLKELNDLSADQLKNIRNLGRKSYAEICNRLREFGYDVSEKEAMLL